MFDPVADRYARPLAASLEEAVRGCDAIVLMVGHDAFAAIDPAAIAPLCRAQAPRRHAGASSTREPWAAAGFDVYTLGGKRSAARRLAASA